MSVKHLTVRPGSSKSERLPRKQRAAGASPARASTARRLAVHEAALAAVLRALMVGGAYNSDALESALANLEPVRGGRR